MTGPANAIFAPDGALLRAWSRWWFWAWTSCCWVVFALPVITGPAATSWLITQQRRYARGEASLGPGETLRFLLRRLLPTLPLAGCHLGVAALVIVGLFGPSPGGPYGWLVLITSSVVGVTWLLLAPWSVVIFERTGRTVESVRLAYRLALARIDLAVTGAGAVGAAVAAVVLLSTRVPYLGPLLALAVPAAVVTVLIMLHDRASELAPQVVRASELAPQVARASELAPQVDRASKLAPQVDRVSELVTRDEDPS